MGTSSTTHWFAEEMPLWVAFPLFIALIPVLYAVLLAFNIVVDPAVPYTMTDAIAMAGMLAGAALGWHGRRVYREG